MKISELVVAGLPAAFVEYSCSHALAFTKNVTDPACQEACLLNCQRTGDVARSLQTCAERVQAGCRLKASLTEIISPKQFCFDGPNLRVRFEATHFVPDEWYNNSVQQSADSPWYRALEETVTYNRLKLAVPDQKKGSGVYNVCPIAFGKDVDFTQPCAIPRIESSTCLRVNVTHAHPADISDNYFAFRDIEGSFMLVHPFFGHEAVDLIIQTTGIFNSFKIDDINTAHLKTIATSVRTLTFMGSKDMGR